VITSNNKIEVTRMSIEHVMKYFNLFMKCLTILHHYTVTYIVASAALRDPVADKIPQRTGCSIA